MEVCWQPNTVRKGGLVGRVPKLQNELALRRLPHRVPIGIRLKVRYNYQLTAYRVVAPGAKIALFAYLQALVIAANAHLVLQNALTINRREGPGGRCAIGFLAIIHIAFGDGEGVNLRHIRQKSARRPTPIKVDGLAYRLCVNATGKAEKGKCE